MTPAHTRQIDDVPSSQNVLRIAAGSVIALLMCSLQVGCGETVDAEVLATRKKLVLTQQPTGEESVSKIRETLGEEGVETVDVVIRGRIHAGDLPPWEKGKAAFVLTDATGHEGEDDHDPHTCPFCSRNINDYLAMVVFSEDGNDIEIDSRELFDVKEKQLILVRGKARIGEDDLLSVDADGIFLLP